jgi:glycosyltransferase involved in cell wall biosynthesis
MHVAVISALFPPVAIGGAEWMSAQLAQGLQEAGHRVSVLSLQPPADLTAGAQAGVDRVPLRNLYWPYDQGRLSVSKWLRLAWHALDTFNPLMGWRVFRWLKQERPDVVCTNNLQGFSTSVWAAAAVLGLPVVHVLHDFSLLCPRTALFREGRLCGLGDGRCRDCRWLTAARRPQGRWVDAVVGVSGFILDLHRGHGWFKGVPGQVIYNALPDALLGRELLSVATATRVLRLGFLGRVDEAKGVPVLLAAASLLRQRGVAVELFVAGRGAESDVARWKLQFADVCVRWMGHVSPDVLWPLVDVLVLASSSREALGSVVLEAAACGVPSVVSDQGGAVELVEPGISGDVFSAGNAIDLADVLARWHAVPGAWRRMGVAAHAKAQVFSVSRRVRAFVSVFDKVRGNTSVGVDS